jgi:hypothetical protein
VTHRQAAARIRRAARARAGLGATPSPVATAKAALWLRGLPWAQIAAGAAVLAVGALVLGGSSSEREERDNPSDDDEQAERFYTRFHWGRRPTKRKRVKLPPTPRRLVELGTLEAVTYAAKKGAEGLVDYVHSFGEEGGRKPTLAADPRSKRLHIVGGDYDVQGRGIVD